MRFLLAEFYSNMNRQYIKLSARVTWTRAESSAGYDEDGDKIITTSGEEKKS